MSKLLDKLREAIKNRGITNYAICKKTGIDNATLSRFMRGERVNLNSKTIDALLALLGDFDNDLILLDMKADKDLVYAGAQSKRKLGSVLNYLVPEKEQTDFLIAHGADEIGIGETVYRLLAETAKRELEERGIHIDIQESSNVSVTSMRIFKKWAQHQPKKGKKNE